MPSQSCSASFFTVSAGNFASESVISATGSTYFWQNSRTPDRISWCSSVKLKFIAFPLDLLLEENPMTAKKQSGLNLGPGVPRVVIGQMESGTGPLQPQHCPLLPGN